MKTASEIIRNLQKMIDAYGDLPVTITIAFKKSELQQDDDNVLISSEELFIALDEFKDRSNEINIRSFIY